MKSFDFNNFIQVAGIIDQHEADMLISCGVRLLGFPLRLPVNKEDLTESEAQSIFKCIRPPNYGVVITYSSTADEAVELCDTLGSQIIQLHGPINQSELRKIREKNPSLIIIKSLVVKNDNYNALFDVIKLCDRYVDAYITDTFDPLSGASGATGKIHDWNISKNLIELTSKPVILAGGLNPDNVYEAIKFVEPAGVDVHTGVEDQSGRKDKELVDKFINEAKKAFSEIENDNQRI